MLDTYRKDVDCSLLRENLRLSVEERFIKFRRMMNRIAELQRAGVEARLRTREAAPPPRGTDAS